MQIIDTQDAQLLLRKKPSVIILHVTAGLKNYWVYSLIHGKLPLKIPLNGTPTSQEEEEPKIEHIFEDFQFKFRI